MTGRDSLATVLKVAELRERVARGAVTLAVATEQRACAAEHRAEQHLAALPDEADLRLAAARAGLRAGALLDAQRATAQAGDLTSASVAAYVESARRTSLLTQLAARKAAEREQAVLAAEQRLADDLAGLRRRAPR